MVRSAISANDDSLPSFPMMLGHFLAGVLFGGDVLDDVLTGMRRLAGE